MRRTPRVKCNERDRSPWAWDNPAFRYCPKRSESVIEFILRVHGSMGWRLPTQKALAIDGDLNIMLALSIPINCYGFRRVIKSLRGVHFMGGPAPHGTQVDPKRPGAPGVCAVAGRTPHSAQNYDKEKNMFVGHGRFSRGRGGSLPLFLGWERSPPMNRPQKNGGVSSVVSGGTRPTKSRFSMRFLISSTSRFPSPGRVRRDVIAKCKHSLNGSRLQLHPFLKLVTVG